MDGGLPPWGLVKERAMSSLCPETFYMSRQGEGNLMLFSDLDLTSYARTELSGRRRGDGGKSLLDRVDATMGVILSLIHI